MEDRSANIGVAAIVRALQTKHETDSTDERIDGLMLDGNAHGRRVVGIEHATVHHFDLRLDVKAVVERMEAPTRFGGERERVRVVASRSRAQRGRDVKAVLQATDLAGHIHEHAVVGEPGAVAREGIRFAVAVAVGEVVVAVRVGDGTAKPHAGHDLTVIAELEGRVTCSSRPSCRTLPCPCRHVPRRRWHRQRNRATRRGACSCR